MVKTQKVHPGSRVGYWVNIFKHRLDNPTIEFCYDDFPSEPIKMTSGKYRLTLVARGTPNEEHIVILLIIMNRKGNLKITPSKYEKPEPNRQNK